MQNESVLITVTIPVYNTEKYLEACLDSVLAQTYGEFELVIINNGSIDSSGQILEQYAKKDDRVRIIHWEKNRGLSAARLEGLRQAKGEYICWWDSDDLFSPHLLSMFVQMIRETNADIAWAQSISSMQPECVMEERKKMQQDLFAYDIYDDFAALYEERSNMDNLNCTMWLRMFRKSLFQDLDFDELKKRFPLYYCEEHVIVPFALRHAKTIAVTDEIGFYYRDYATSSSKNDWNTYRKISPLMWDAVAAKRFGVSLWEDCPQMQSYYERLFVAYGNILLRTYYRVFFSAESEEDKVDKSQQLLRRWKKDKTQIIRAAKARNNKKALMSFYLFDKFRFAWLRTIQLVYNGNI